MEPLDYSDLSIASTQLSPPTLEELAAVLKTGLAKNYAEVDVEITNCPDLTKEPYKLAAKGLGGNTCVVQVGDPSYVIPDVLYEKVYSFKQVAKAVNLSDGFIVGCGGGPWPRVNRFCEMIANAVIRNNEMKCFTKNVCSIDKKKRLVELIETPAEEHRFASLANLFCSQGEPGKVLKVWCRNRTGSDSFPEAICSSIRAEFKNPVGLGVIFQTLKGIVKHHVAPSYPRGVKDLMNWLNMPQILAPLISVGTIINKNPDGFSLLSEHFHSYTVDNSSGGHYHRDITPESVEHLAHIVPAEKIYVIDKSDHPTALFK